MISEGGDTDTNAAIVGGLIGAVLGIDRIDKEKVDKVANYMFTEEGQKQGKA